MSEIPSPAPAPSGAAQPAHQQPPAAQPAHQQPPAAQPAHQQPAAAQPAHQQPAEDAKLVTLARSARGRAYAARTGLAEGAAVRDSDGRTYAAATVEHGDPALTTTALRGAVAAAASSGARRFEAAAVVSEEAALDEPSLAVLREFGIGVPVRLVAPDGSLRAVELT